MIDLPYTLFNRICIFRDAQGGYFTDELWQQDLEAHFRYLSEFRLCCPVLPLDQAPDRDQMVRITGLSDANVTALRPDGGWGSVLRNLWPNFRQVARALRRTTIAHSGGAGWAFPLSYYLLALRLVRRFQWVMVIESSFWMKPQNGPVSARQALRHTVNLWLVRACIRRADARIFTQDWYRRIFLGGTERSLIAPAVWVSSDQIATPDQIAPPTAPGEGPLRVLFPARLIPAKGVQMVMDTIALLAERGVPVKIDIMGRGEMEQACRRFCEARPDIQTAFIDPVPYGAPFFDVLQGYDALLVANLQEEQPRIIFDAYSQGVPCVSSETEGTRDLVIAGQTGYLFGIGDAAGLADLLGRIAVAELALADLRPKALAFAQKHTHAQMHRTREAFLRDTLSLSAGPE